MKIAKLFAMLVVLALALVAHPTCAGAQDKTTHTYTVVVGHVVTVGWTASVTTDVTSYNIYVGSVSGGPYNKIGSTSTLQFQDLNATAGNTYYYVVTAVDVNGESAYSTEASAKIPTP